MENITTNLVQVMESLEHLNKRYADAFIPFVVVIGIMALIGVIGNIIVLLAFCLSKEYKDTNFKIFVICLALLDLLSCVTIIPAEIVKSRNFFSFHSLTLCKLKCFSNVFFTTAAAMALLTICIDRFRKVCQPLKKQIYPGLALKIIIGAMVFSFVVSLPASVMCGINPANKTNIYNTTTTVYLCTDEKNYQTSILIIIYKFGMTLILFVGSVTLIIMYVLIGRIVIRHWRVRKSMGSSIIESNRYPDPSEKIQGERPTQDVFVVDCDVISEPTSPFNNIESVKNVPPKQDRRTMRTGSSFIASSNSTQTNFSVNKKKGSMSPFQARARHRKSILSHSGVPYKTLVWLILTIIFIVTYFLYAILSFFTTLQLSPKKMLGYNFLLRIYFINNMINPLIYAWLDQRFKTQCKELYDNAKRKILCLCLTEK